MMYKTELHLHSVDVSSCATATAEEIVEAYTAAGYTTVVLTNHMSIFTYKNKRYDYSHMTWQEKCDFYMAGYHALQKAAGDRLHVILGMELRSNVKNCDYLIYGMTEEFMREFPDMMDEPFRSLSARIRKAGMLLCQAHPFRNGVSVTGPEFLDAMETYNVNTLDFRNEVAEMWARNYGLIEISGSDFHHADRHLIHGGIATDTPITSNEELLAVLRGGDYALIRKGEIVDK